MPCLTFSSVRIEGFLKTQKLLKPREREGFIRIDFYTENFDLENVGILSSVSSRVYGTDDWVNQARGAGN